MKQINKYLSLMNITFLIFAISLGLAAENYFDYYDVINLISFIMFALSNIIIGIINIKKDYKRIGINNIIISIIQIAIYLSISIKLKQDWIVNLFYILILIWPILSIINLVVNKKTNENKKKFIYPSLFIIVSIVEIILVAIPVKTNKMNLNAFNKTAELLSNQTDKTIAYSYKDDENVYHCNFYDNNGNLISSKQYELISYDNYYNYKANNNTITFFIVIDNNELWLVDYNGEKIERLYGLTTDLKTSIFTFSRILKSNYSFSYNFSDDVLHFIPINSISDNALIFGDSDNCQIKVIFDENTYETETNFYDNYKYYLELEQEYNTYTDEQLKELEELYKYSKTYYIIDKNGNEKQLDCKNLIFTYDFDNNLSIWLYSNNYMPYFDNNSSGYFDDSGNKVVCNNGNYLIYDTTDNYMIIYDNSNTSSEKFYLMFYNDNNIIDLDCFSLENYNNDYIITSDYIYKINSNNHTIAKLSDFEYSRYILINFDDDINNTKLVPYENWKNYQKYLNILSDTSN